MELLQLSSTKFPGIEEPSPSLIIMVSQLHAQFMVSSHGTKADHTQTPPIAEVGLMTQCHHFEYSQVLEG